MTPFLASAVMAPQLLLALGDGDANSRLLPGLAFGESSAPSALAEDRGSWQPPDVTTTATRTDADWVLDGQHPFVLDGAIAGLLLVAARVDIRSGVFAVDAEHRTGWIDQAAAGNHRPDAQAGPARVRRHTCPARGVAATRVRAAIDAMLDREAVAVAADRSAARHRVLEMAVDYAKVREQFGRPIGSFQAIKHKCASMLVNMQSSRSAVLLRIVGGFR